MRYPGFIAAVARPSERPKLWIGVWSGYAMAAAFAILALAAQSLELVPARWEFFALLGAKLVTNTLALWSLRTDRGVLELHGLNTACDLLVMTGAIYVTGGVVSPLLPIYVIEIAVVALLTNLGVTLLVAISAWLAFALMALASHGGVLIAYPPPVATAGGVSPEYMATAIVFMAFVLGVPTFWTSLILRRLAAREAALEARTAELIEAGKNKSLFMANITHELRTPIHGICGLSDLVSTGLYGAVTDKQRNAHDAIKRSATQLLQLVDDLLQLARAEAGRLDFRPAEVDLHELTRACVSAARWMLGTSKELALAVDIADDVPVVVTDRGKLNHVLINLLSNAVKFTPGGGTVRVVVRRSGDAHVSISVQDDGPGVPRDKLETIFEAFQQADGKMEREYGGVGLGLSLVKHLSGAVGAEISVDSEPRRGTTFTLLLPVRPATTAAGA